MTYPNGLEFKAKVPKTTFEQLKDPGKFAGYTVHWSLLSKTLEIQHGWLKLKSFIYLVIKLTQLVS